MPRSQPKTSRTSRRPAGRFQEALEGRPSGRLLSLEDAARRVDLSVETLRSWRKRERAGAHVCLRGLDFARRLVTVGRSVRISEFELDDWIRWCRELGGGQRYAGSDELGDVASRLREAEESLSRIGRHNEERLISVVLEMLRDSNGGV